MSIEWLSDNGSPYTAGETRRLAREIGLMPRTPIESPQSNGMAEAFVKTFKRDYAHSAARPGAASVLRQLDGWFESSLSRLGLSTTAYWLMRLIRISGPLGASSDRRRLPLR